MSEDPINECGSCYGLRKELAAAKTEIITLQLSLIEERARAKFLHEAAIDNARIGCSIADREQAARAEIVTLRAQVKLMVQLDFCAESCAAVLALTAADYAGKTVVDSAELAALKAQWQTGIPEVREGALQRFWCATKRPNQKLQHEVLCYGNKYVMPLADTQDMAPACAVPVGDDGDYEWSGWWSESCDNCETFWIFSGEVVAWMKMPKMAPSPAAPEAGQ